MPLYEGKGRLARRQSHIAIELVCVPGYDVAVCRKKVTASGFLGENL
jgi:hypothetical protein